MPFYQIKDLSPADFIEELERRFRAKGIIVGENFKFGRNRSGDVAFLRSIYPEKDGFSQRSHLSE